MRKIAVGNLIDQFISSISSHSAESTVRFYGFYLRSFRAFVAGKRPDQVTSSVVYAWINKCYGNQSPSSQHAAARCVVRLFNWADDENLIERTPLRGFRKPAPSRRELIVTPPQYANCVKESRGPLRDVIKFLWHTGCRPQELRVIQARWMRGSKIVLPALQSKGKKRQRVIFLDALASNVAARLSAKHSNGAVFRNSHGDEWTKNSLALSIRRLAHRTGISGLCAYSFRHSFITRMLERGVDVATVAAITGTSARMILEVYQHVAANEARILSLLG